MDRTRRLLGATILGLVVTAAGGCGKGRTPEFQTPGAGQPADAVPSVADATPQAAAAPETVATPSVVPDALPESVAGDPFLDDPIVPEISVTGDAATPEPSVPAEPVVDPAPASADIVPAGGTDSADNLIAAAGSTNIAIAAITEPREAQLLIPEKTFRMEGEALRVSYDDIDLLKVLNMEPVVKTAPDMFPQWLKDLEGQRIRIRGYMRPGELAEDIPFFVLARDTQACCFGPNTKPYDIIPVIMREGVTTEYIHLQPFDIVGVFHISVEEDFANPEKVEFLYVIDDAVLIQK